MKVELTDHTQDAVNKLIKTKLTRLNFAEAQSRVDSMTEMEKMDELDYMSKTIPSSWEFVNYTFQISEVSRAFTHQFVRTRTMSFAQQSMRVIPMQGFTYLIPDKIKSNPSHSEVYNRVMSQIADGYKELVDIGAATEDARGVLPTNIHTNIAVNCSLRTLAELVAKRSSGRVQGEYRYVLQAMKEEVYKVHPWAELFLENDMMKRAAEAEEQLNKILALHPEDKNENNMEAPVYTNIRKFFDLVRSKL